MERMRLVTILLILIFTCGELLAQETPFDYCSPMPGATLVSTESGIILRSKGLLEAGVPVSGMSVTLTGSKSGSQTLRARLSRDGRTLLFRPLHPFQLNERVTVSFHAGVKTIAGKQILPSAFSFTTQDRKIPFDRRLMATDDIPGGTVPGQTAARAGLRHTGSGVDTLPPDFPTIKITASKPVPPGHMFIDNFDNNATVGYYLIDVATTGAILRYSSRPSFTLDYKKQPNGRISYFDESTAGFILMDSLYNVLNTYRTVGYATDWHDFMILPNGHFLLIGDDPEHVSMDSVVTGGNPDAIVTGIILQELDQDSNVVFQWRSWDHFRITDAIGVNLTAATIDYVHSNAIDTDYDGNILLSSRHLDEITKIDRTTGNIIWRWGGVNNQFTFLGDPLQFTYQHAIRRIPNGHYTLFDNGDYHNPQYSRAMEYALDQNAKTATAVWEYRNNPDIYGFATGYVQRLDDGNTLICWGAANPNVSLVAPDGSKIFDLTMPNGIWTYRAYMYPLPPLGLSVTPAAESLFVADSVRIDSLKVLNLSQNETRFTLSNHQPWLLPGVTIDSIPGSDSVSIKFTIRTAGLQPWRPYRDTLTITGFDTILSTIQIPFTLQIPGLKLFITPPAVSVSLDSSTTAQDTLKISNIGPFPLICLLSDPDTAVQAWITFSPAADTIAPGDSILRIIHINAATQPPGDYSTGITVSSNDSIAGTVHVPMTVHVLPIRTIPVTVSSDWNLISLPVQPHSALQLPASDSTYTFTYDNSYVITDSLREGIGFWMKFDSAQTFQVTGGLLVSAVIPVNAGWNMIGAISTPVAAASITSDPPGMETSPAFSYHGGYSAADSLLPGKGYWLKAGQAGTITLTAGGSSASRTRIRIVATSERPPDPPAGNGPAGSTLPKVYALDQAYPNPFNPSATIRYQLPEESRVSLSVYNVLGQLVQVLEDGVENAGYRQVSWDATAYASGIYFYRLEATGVTDPSKSFSSVRKMVLIK